jgi:hypothetical protein
VVANSISLIGFWVSGTAVAITVGAGIFFALFANLPVTLGTQAIYFALHSLQQLFGRLCGDARPPQGLNLFALPEDLATHVLNFVSDNRRARAFTSGIVLGREREATKPLMNVALKEVRGLSQIQAF